MESSVANGSVHIGRKQRQRNCPQICALVSSVDCDTTSTSHLRTILNFYFHGESVLLVGWCTCRFVFETTLPHLCCSLNVMCEKIIYVSTKKTGKTPIGSFGTAVCGYCFQIDIR